MQCDEVSVVGQKCLILSELILISKFINISLCLMILSVRRCTTCYTCLTDTLAWYQNRHPNYFNAFMCTLFTLHLIWKPIFVVLFPLICWKNGQIELGNRMLWFFGKYLKRHYIIKSVFQSVNPFNTRSMPSLMMKDNFWMNVY